MACSVFHPTLLYFIKENCSKMPCFSCLTFDTISRSRSSLSSPKDMLLHTFIRRGNYVAINTTAVPTYFCIYSLFTIFPCAVFSRSYHTLWLFPMFTSCLFFILLSFFLRIFICLINIFTYFISFIFGSTLFFFLLFGF